MYALSMVAALLASTSPHFRSCRRPIYLRAVPKSNDSPPTKGEVKTYEVCLSPGCVADGAEATLEMMRALAPPDVSVVPGGCSSLCGNGPVVINNDGKSKESYKWVKGSKALDLLYKDRNRPDLLIQGYELAVKGDEAFFGKEYEKAVIYYEKSVNLSFRAAIDLREARAKRKAKEGQVAEQPGNELEWLIRARRNEATAKLELGDTGGAMLAAQASCNLSRNLSADAFEVLASVYQKKGDAAGELHALQTMFALTDEKVKLPPQAANRRRELGFRMAKLEREVSQ